MLSGVCTPGGRGRLLERAHRDILKNHMMMWSLLTCTMTFASLATLILTAQTGALSHFNEKRLEARLGDEVIIPCTDHEVNLLDAYRWFYRKNSQASKRDMIFQNNKAGLNHISSHLWKEKKTLRNFSLVIMNFKEEDQGIYTCEICPGTGQVCTKGLDTSLLLIKESPPAVPKRVYAAEGGNFTHPCYGGAGGSGPSASWTFRRFGEPSPAPWSHQRGGLQPNGSIFIRDVQASDAGTYSCVRGRNSDLTQTLLSLSLCVLTAGPVGSSVSRGSPLTCSVHCDVSPEPVVLPRAPGESSGVAAVVVETGTVTFQVRPGEREGTVVCYANETGESGVEDSTLHLDTENNQEDANTTPLALFLCVSLASGFCTLAIFLGFVFLCRRRLIAAFPTADEPSGDVLCPKRTRDTTPEMGEAAIIYSVLEIKQPEKDRVLVREDGCVYSTIQHQ
ncbi:mediator of RNA polymerase II transcription subunit 18 isoform X1 [Anguilla rostrata]|uniref:mediator of RNA polymerase II transcription subunit 18 isoform X1 n=2 Tax=Anguilla rostrata TaxID=7938 RepID=UPI0030CE69A4